MAPKRQAKFIGIQKGFEEMPDFPLFNIDAPNDPRDGSTVTEDELKELGINAPRFKAEV